MTMRKALRETDGFPGDSYTYRFRARRTRLVAGIRLWFSSRRRLS